LHREWQPIHLVHETVRFTAPCLFLWVKGKVHPRTGNEGPGGEQYSCTLSLTSALDGGGKWMPHPGHYLWKRDFGIHCTGSWVGPRAGLKRCGKTCPHGIQSLNCPACSKLSNCLHYPRPLFLRG
jgi:hypothetical protein